MRTFLPSCLVTALALVLAFLWAGWQGAGTCALLLAMDVSFSFDNAVVNAIVLKRMNALWQRRFLTWGMLIAVFGMYYLFPILIVSVATGLNLIKVMHLALHVPDEYHRHLMESHTQIAAFGGMFLLMVFFAFLMNGSKERHWLGKMEEKLARLGKLESVEIVIALVILLALQAFLPDAERLHALIAGFCGIALYVAINGVTALFGVEGGSGNYSGLMGFLYLNLLDASFSLDAVVGSFAISGDIILIVLGLSAGAMFVRSLTVHLVRRGTLERYVFLEHGAHYAIGALAAIMLISLYMPVPEAIPGLAGIVLILLSLASSVKYNRKGRP